MDDGGSPRHSLEIPQAHLPDSPMARHSDVVRCTALSNIGWQCHGRPRLSGHTRGKPQCTRTWRSRLRTLAGNDICIWWRLASDRPLSGSSKKMQRQPLHGTTGTEWKQTTAVLLRLPMHTAPTGIGPERRYGFQLKMVGDEQGIPCMSDICNSISSMSMAYCKTAVSPLPTQ